MNLVVEGIMVVVASIVSLVYVSWGEIRKQETFALKIKALLHVSLKKKVYFLLNLVVGVGLVVVLNLLYKETTIMDQIKVITVIMLLIPCAWTDYKKMIIPNKIIVTGLLLRVVYFIPELIVDNERFIQILKDDVIAALIMIVFLAIGLLIVRTGLGFGDMKLLLMMACYKGVSGIIGCLFFSLLIAFFVSLYLLIGKRKQRKDTIPFAPFILVGTCISAIITGI